MLILTIRTDKPEAEIGLFNGKEKREYFRWQAHRELAESIHLQIKELLDRNQKNLDDLEGIAVYKGPGSFTGLRIGITVANSLANSLKIPVTSETNEGWAAKANLKLLQGVDDRIIVPEYGSPPHITKPKH
jgi:tRNA threonylcarbamoyladenosine biosynthesis protein TsaB